MDRKKRYTSLDKVLFNGCAICDGMKKAAREGHNLTEKELRKLFKKANGNRHSLSS